MLTEMEASARSKRQKLSPNSSPQTNRACAVLLSPASLTKQCIRVVASHYNCESLQNCQPPLDDLLLQKISVEAFPTQEKEIELYAKLATDQAASVQDRDPWVSDSKVKPPCPWDNALRILGKSDVLIREAIQVGFLYTATVVSVDASTSPSSSTSSSTNTVCTHKTQPSIRKSRVSISFECKTVVSTSCSVCRHNWCQHVIAAILFRMRNPDKVPCHVPMTETLMNMDRDKLQKIIQYAVQSDPGSTLYKIFQHIEDLRDPKATINTAAGAPDPTFVPQEDTLALTSTTLEKLKKNVKDTLMKSVRLWRYTTISDEHSCRLNPKCMAESDLKEYLTQIEDLMQRGYTKLAAKLLILVTQAAVEASQQRNTQTTLHAHFLHSLERLFSIAIINPDNSAKEELLDAARKFREDCTVIRYLRIPHTAWLEVPNVMGEESLDTSSLFFSEALQVANVDWENPGLKQILDGTVNFREATFDEPIAVTLLRVEALHLLKHSGAGRLGMYSLFRLLQLSNNHAIAVFEEAPEVPVTRLTQSSSAVTHSVGKKRKKERQSKILTATRKSKRLKNMSMASTSPSASSSSNSSSSVSHIWTSELTVAQLVPSLLYVCGHLIADMNTCTSNLITEDATQLIAQATMRVLDLMRFYRFDEQIGYDGRDFLSAESNKCTLYVLKLGDQVMQPVKQCIDAINGYNFKDDSGVCPLQLAQFLIDFAKRMNTENFRKDLVSMCKHIICSYTQPMDGMHLWFGRSDKFIGLVDYVLNNVHIPEERKVLTEILDHLPKVDDTSLVYSILCAISKHKFKFGMASLLREMLIAMKEYLVKTKSNPHAKGQEQHRERYFKYERTRIIDNIMSTLAIGGLKYIDVFSTGWEEYADSNFIIRILTIIQTSLQFPSGTIPKHVVELLLSALKHDKGYITTCFVPLLTTLKFLASDLKKIISFVIKNAQNIHPEILWKLAKFHHDKVSGKDAVCQPKDITMKLILATIYSMHKHPFDYAEIDSKYEFIDWTNALCFAGKVSDVAKSDVFTKYLDAIATNCTSLPCVLLRVLSCIEKKATFFRHRTQLCDALLPANKAYFVNYFQKCGRAQSAYEDGIELLSNMRRKCQEYVKNGAERFDKEVLPHIQQYHKSKKKLLRMISITFKLS